MYKMARPFFMIVETPLHAGSGTGLGIVDQPIQREKHTDFPKIEASGIKGVIRNAFDKKYTNDSISLAFGPKDGNDHAGALGFTDARLLLFPVKSMKGIFAWVTCPKILERFRNDLRLSDFNDIPDIPNKNKAPSNCELFIKDNKMVLEEYTFNMEKDDTCSTFAEWVSEKIFPQGDEYGYWREKVKRNLVVLSDDDFRDFVTLSTEVITRTKIDSETGTVKEGALFNEEYLPSETIMYSLALATTIFNEEKGRFEATDEKSEEELVMEYFMKGLPSVMQIGGNATIGKGIVRTRKWRDENNG